MKFHTPRQQSRQRRPAKRRPKTRREEQKIITYEKRKLNQSKNSQAKARHHRRRRSHRTKDRLLLDIIASLFVAMLIVGLCLCVALLIYPIFLPKDDYVFMTVRSVEPSSASAMVLETEVESLGSHIKLQAGEFYTVRLQFDDEALAKAGAINPEGVSLQLRLPRAIEYDETSLLGAALFDSEDNCLFCETVELEARAHLELYVLDSWSPKHYYQRWLVGNCQQRDLFCSASGHYIPKVNLWTRPEHQNYDDCIEVTFYADYAHAGLPKMNFDDPAKSWQNHRNLQKIKPLPLANVNTITLNADGEIVRTTRAID